MALPSVGDCRPKSAPRPWSTKVGTRISSALVAAVQEGVADQRTTSEIVSGFVRRVRGIEPPCEAMVKAKRRAALEALL